MQHQPRTSPGATTSTPLGGAFSRGTGSSCVGGGVGGAQHAAAGVAAATGDAAQCGGAQQQQQLHGAKWDHVPAVDDTREYELLPDTGGRLISYQKEQEC
ncbi:hypothetical protein Pelo_16581 [Pelomyxa schiedti]|nr:hypothetical protein Pelo_16581 [Pelomyxa schiedti]